jgi:hypothetical protein
VKLNALGLSLYNEVKALTEVTINEPANLKFKKLIQGDEYDDIWLDWITPIH